MGGRTPTAPVKSGTLTDHSQYAAMFGSLSGLFLNLLDEANITPERLAYYKDARTAIDKRNRSAHNGTQDNPDGTT